MKRKPWAYKMSQPFFKIRDMVEQHSIAVLTSNFELYSDMSNRVMSVIEHFVPEMSQYSVDEAFIDLSQMSMAQMQDLTDLLRKTIYRWTGIPVAIGVAKTKTLAKIAAKQAKQYRSGTMILHDQVVVDGVLRRVKVEDIWGIGRSLSIDLKGRGIYYAHNLKGLNANYNRKILGLIGERVIKELNGIVCGEFACSDDEQKSITVSRSFNKPLYAKQDLFSAVATFVEQAGERLRKHQLRSGMLQLYIRTGSRDANYYSNSQAIPIQPHIQSTVKLLEVARLALNQIYKKDVAYKKASITLTDFLAKEQQQYSLFDNEQEDEQATKLSHAMDKINHKWGAKINHASSKVTNTWQYDKALMSKRCTTSWDELKQVS